MNELELEELKATAVKLQQQIEELEKPKKWEPTMDLDWLDYCNHINTYTRLLQYVKEFGGDWEANWKDHIHLNYYVQYSNHRKKWEVGGRYMECVSGTVHMSKECAEGLVDKLNSGEVVL